MKNPKISVIIIYSDNENAVRGFIESLAKQKYTDYEAVFVNCCSNEHIINIVSEYVADNDKWSIITLPDNADCKKAKQSALNIVSGEFICFTDTETQFESDFLENICQNYYKNEINSINAENNKLYKRSFIENNSEFRDIIKVQIENEMKHFLEEFKKFDESIAKKLHDCYKNSDELVNNKFYIVTERMKFLENFIQEKENIIKSNINESVSAIVESQINAGLNKNTPKSYEQEEIYTIRNQVEQVFDKKILEQNSKLASLEQRVENLCHEQNEKYNNLLNTINDFKKEINIQFEAFNIISGENSNDKLEKASRLLHMEQTINNNFDAVYSVINDNNKRFYQELTYLYKDIEEKIRKKSNTNA